LLKCSQSNDDTLLLLLKERVEPLGIDFTGIAVSLPPAVNKAGQAIRSFDSAPRCEQARQAKIADGLLEKFGRYDNIIA
jgi:hypothetical protein